MSRHIVQVSAYYPPHLGGQENAVHDLSGQLASAGHRVDVLTSARGGGKKGVTKHNNVRVNRMPGAVVGHAPIMPTFPHTLLQAAGPQSLVHLHIGQAFTPEMVWLASKLRGFKYVAQLHIDFEPSGPLGFLLPWYKKLILRPVLQSASAVIALNQKTLDTIHDFYDYTGRTLILDNGIEEAYFELQRPPFAPKPPHTLKLLFVGRLSKQKNILSLLAALKITKRPVHLDLIGEGDQREIAQQTIKNLELTNVTLHGRLGRTEVMKFYQTCDALIMPSLYEAQPLVLLEAMAARVPIIGTNVIGVAEHIHDAGIVVEPTPQGLADGIEQYFARYHELPQMVERGFANMQARRWPNLLKKYEGLYEEVMAD